MASFWRKSNQHHVQEHIQEGDQHHVQEQIQEGDRRYDQEHIYFTLLLVINMQALASLSNILLLHIKKKKQRKTQKRKKKIGFPREGIEPTTS